MEFLPYIQSFSTPALDILFQAITLLGEDSLILPLTVLIYWCYDKELGFRLGALYGISLILSHTLKDLVEAPRPIGLEGIRSLRLETATGYSFPSGHTQGAATFWTAMSQYIHKRWFYLLTLIIIILVGFSRLYLGVHFPEDVLWGAVFGILVTLLGGPALNALEKYKSFAIIGFILLAAIAAAMALSDSSNTYKAAGVLAGLLSGRHFEKRRINFTAKSGIGFGIIKFVTGMGVLLIIKEGLKIALPESLPSDFLRYLAIGLWASAGAPWCFVKLFKSA
ncbi:MAG: phosphatase PAP2 family protein [Desulfocucumaceae bacterium]